MTFRALYEKLEAVGLDIFLFGAEVEAVRCAETFLDALHTRSDVDFGSCEEVPVHIEQAFAPLWEFHMRSVARAEAAVSKKATVH
ncbi:MAG: hypothetical protein AAB581_00110 [Patescibacteria group bacterium]